MHPSDSSYLQQLAGRSDPARAQIPSSDERIAVCRPLLPSVDKVASYLAVADTNRWYSNHGELVLTLRRRLRDRLKKRALVVTASSGTSALAGAILAAAGRATLQRPLCLMPAYTFIGTVSAAEQCGFVPHLVDVEASSWMLEPGCCAAHPLLDQVGLVIPVAPYGRPVAQAPWQAFERETGVPVAIDAAASIEFMFADPDRFCGSIPVAVSFHATKSFCTGEGGAVICADPDTSQSADRSLNFGYDLDRLSKGPAINGKMSEYHAAVGLAELDGWDAKIADYRRAASYLADGGRASGGTIHLAPEIACNYALFEATSAEHARAVRRTLIEARIGHRMWYGGGIHTHPYCAAFGRDDLTAADDLALRLIGLPMSVDLTEADAALVLNGLRQSH